MKRFLHVLGVLAGGIFVALLVLGLFVPQVSYTTTVNVAASVEDTWATFVDGDRMAEWMTGLENMELISGGPEEVGSHYRLHFDSGEILDEQITAITPHEQFSFDMEATRFTGSVDVTFRPQDDGTRMVQVTTVRGTSFLWRTILPVVKPLMQNEQMKILDRLAMLIEYAPTEVPAPASESAQQ